MIKAILFDYDGVLVDSFEAYAPYYQKIVEKHGDSVPSKEEIRKHYYLTDHDLFQALSGEHSEEKIKAMLSDPEPEPFDNIVVADGVKGTLEAMKAYKLGVVSSAPREHVLTPLVRHGIDGYFTVVITGEDTHLHKPDPAPIKLALSKLRVNPEEAVYIGDYPTDITAGKAAGTKVIYFSKVPDGREDARVKSFSGIPSAVAGIEAAHANV